MKKFLKLAAVCSAFLMTAQYAGAQKVSELEFTNVKDLIKQGRAVMIGQAEKGTADSAYYYRLPDRMKGVVRNELWDLGKNSAGIAIRFSSNAKCIGLKWTLINNFNMAHMAGTGIRGLDIYTLADYAAPSDGVDKSANTGEKFKEAFKSLGKDAKKAGKNAVNTVTGKSSWIYVGVVFPNGKNSSGVFVRKMDGKQREYLMYLPLYDGIENLEIGVDSSAQIAAPQSTDLLTANAKGPSGKKLPIVFYGTSVTQGGCASRPGMAYPAIVERALGRETINLGFSGNGRMDKSMANFVTKIPASAYIIDCLANCDYDMVRDSSDYFITKIAAAHPSAPVIMVTNYRYPQQSVSSSLQEETDKENALWKSIFERLAKKYTNLHYLDISGNVIDNEDTVDGTHLTDRGFTHIAQEFIGELRSVMD